VSLPNNEDPAAIRDLLNKAGSIVEKYDAIARETGRNFNVFYITDTWKDEVTVCRVLAELLDPKGKHGQGSVYLRLFLRECLGIKDDSMPDYEIEKLSVTPERAIDNNRRIDIAIEGNKRFIPIEVKIESGDLDGQCHDYCMYARFYDSDAKIVYLTNFGDMPSKKSKGSLKDDDIIPISFMEDIVHWLEKCLALPTTIRKPPVREILIQFISAIRKFTNQLEDGQMTEIKSLLKSEQDMRDAKTIMDAFEERRREKVREFFEEFHKRFHKRFCGTLEPIKPEDYDYERKPGICELAYMYDNKSEDETVIFVLTTGVGGKEDSYLLMGFAPAKLKGGKYKRLTSVEEIINRIRREYGVERKTRSDYFVDFHYPVFDGSKIELWLKSGAANKECENFFKLLDPVKFDKIVDCTIEQAERMIEEMENTRRKVDDTSM
jgi:hypothetical protein